MIENRSEGCKQTAVSINLPQPRRDRNATYFPLSTERRRVDGGVTSKVRVELCGAGEAGLNTTS